MSKEKLHEAGELLLKGTLAVTMMSGCFEAKYKERQGAQDFCTVKVGFEHLICNVLKHYCSDLIGE